MKRWFPFSEWSAERSPLRPRLVCLPWAGGGASGFRPWIAELRGIADVFAAEMPGHGLRFGESCIDDAATLTTAIAGAILALPHAERPVLIYGHSMGALLGFETARILVGRSHPVLGLVLSGYHAPHWRGPERQRSRMTDAELVEDLRGMGGTAPQVLDAPDLLSVLLPILRSDYRLTETYRPSLDSLLPKFPRPVDVIGGEQDEENPPESLQAWQEVLDRPLQVSLWQGGHFFIEMHRRALLAHLGRRLAEWPQLMVAGR
ncbi:thioesterase II family protein [Inquilinus sp. 2KB_12]